MPSGTYSYLVPDERTKQLLSEWMTNNNIPNPVPPDKLHVTVTMTEKKFGFVEPLDAPINVSSFEVEPFWSVGEEPYETCENYTLRTMGTDNTTLALNFKSAAISSLYWDRLEAAGDEYAEKTWEYSPHVTLTYDLPDDFDIMSVEYPYFDLTFNEEVFEPLVKCEVELDILKVDEEQRLIYGYANVSMENGELVTDSHGDQISPEELVQAAHNFVRMYRTGLSMHDGDPTFEVVESIVLTKDVQASLGIDLNKVGWFIGGKVHDEQTWQGVKKGELKAFSIGGKGIRELIDEQA